MIIKSVKKYGTKVKKNMFSYNDTYICNIRIYIKSVMVKTTHELIAT